jgi:hypothetical protein
MANESPRPDSGDKDESRVSALRAMCEKLNKKLQEAKENSIRSQFGARAQELMDNVEKTYEYVDSKSENTRSAALFIILSYGEINNINLAILLRAAEHDASPAVRGTAVSGLRRYKELDPAHVINVLCAKLMDENEDPRVREFAYMQIMNSNMLIDYEQKGQDFDYESDVDKVFLSSLLASNT